MNQEGPTIGELQRTILDIKQSDKEYRMAEHDTLQEIKTETGEIKHEVVDIRIQTTKTNGKVISLREDVDRQEVNIDALTKNVESLSGDRKWLLGATAVIIFGIGYIVFSIKVYIKNEVDMGIKSALSAYDIKVNQ